METKILKPTRQNILKSVSLLKRDGVLGCPTETVYGLVSNCFSKKAVENVFKIKKRDFNKPLSCNVSDFDMIFRLTDCCSSIFKILAKNFWPGPLTIVVPKKKEVLDLVTAKKETVAIRFSSNTILRKLTEFFGGPLVIPSANISGEKSSDNVFDVYCNLKGRLEIILDGGKTEFKKESTIVEIKGEDFKILRSGAIEEKEIENVLINGKRE